MDIEGKILNSNFHFKRLKIAFMRTTKGTIDKLADLKQIINLGISICGIDRFV